MFKDSAKPTKANLRTRILAIKEAAQSGAVLASRYRGRNQVVATEIEHAFKQAKGWAETAEGLLE